MDKRGKKILEKLKKQKCSQTLERRVGMSGRSVRLNPSGNKRGMGYFAATPAEKHLWKQVFLVVFDAGWLAKEARDMFRVGEDKWTNTTNKRGILS